MASLEKLYETVPALRAKPDPEVISIWRNFLNDAAQIDLIPLVGGAPTKEGTQTVLARFKEWCDVEHA